MTIPDKLRPWVAPAAGVLVLLLLVGLWNRHHHQLDDAKRAAEAAQLQLRGQIVTAQEGAKDLRADVAKLLAANADLREAVAAARAAAPGAQPIHAATLSTGQLEVVDSPRAPAPTSSFVDKKEEVPSSPPDHPPEAACVLAAGDKASIEVEEVTLQTDQGNVLVVGTAAAWRESPLRAKLFGGKFQATASDASGLAPPSLPRWGAGGGGICMAAGCSAGPVLAFPPVRIFGFQFEATAGVLVGGAGAGLSGTGILRW